MPAQTIGENAACSPRFSPPVASGARRRVPPSITAGHGEPG
jgi:hypothetical protein